jgi:hypothetical protein
VSPESKNADPERVQVPVKVVLVQLPNAIFKELELVERNTTFWLLLPSVMDDCALAGVVLSVSSKHNPARPLNSFLAVIASLLPFWVAAFANLRSIKKTVSLTWACYARRYRRRREKLPNAINPDPNKSIEPGSGVGITCPEATPSAEAVVPTLLNRLPKLQGEILGLQLRVWVVKSVSKMEPTLKTDVNWASPLELVTVMVPAKVAVFDPPDTSIHVTVPVSESPSVDEYLKVLVAPAGVVIG